MSSRQYINFAVSATSLLSLIGVKTLSSMKQRLTYLLPAGTGITPSDIKVVDDTFSFAKADQASEEWRVTLGWDELPDEVSNRQA